MSIFAKIQAPSAARQELKWGWPSLLIALGLPLVAAAIGSSVTQKSVDSWYQTLHKPRWNPPGWVFGPVWSVLYLLMGIASWLVWRSGQDNKAKSDVKLWRKQKKTIKQALILYVSHLGFNVLWSVIFFGLRRIQWALAELLLLWGLIGATLIRFYRIRHVAGWLLVPYLLWATFAALLNARLWQLNRRRA
jgi:tryptophan-rich sensory protein